jgi:hypothetical protein
LLLHIIKDKILGRNIPHGLALDGRRKRRGGRRRRIR